MFERYKTQIDRLIQGAVNTPGDTDLALRKNIIARGKDQVMTTNQSDESLPPDVARFVDKITFTPYEIRDEDVTILQDAGYSDDAIIEIISCASLAAGVARLEIVSAAMHREAGAP